MFKFDKHFHDVIGLKDLTYYELKGLIILAEGSMEMDELNEYFRPERLQELFDRKFLKTERYNRIDEMLIETAPDGEFVNYYLDRKHDGPFHEYYNEIHLFVDQENVLDEDEPGIVTFEHTDSAAYIRKLDAIEKVELSYDPRYLQFHPEGKNS